MKHPMAETHLKNKSLYAFLSPPPLWLQLCSNEVPAYSFLGGMQEDKTTDTTACGEEGWMVPTQADL